MRAVHLHESLSRFAEDAAGVLSEALAAGAEVPFELEPQGGRRARAGGERTVLYAYRALTDEFIAERLDELESLPSHADAAELLESFDGLDAYLVAADIRPRRGGAHARGRAAALALLRELFDGQTDFELRPERLRAALERLDASALSGAGETTLLATLHGVMISTRELHLTRGLTIAQLHALEGLPEGALSPVDIAASEHLVVVLAAGGGEPRAALARGRAVLEELLRALRLFGDGRVTLGSLGWARIAGGRWTPVAVGNGGAPPGMLVVTPEHEDELRAFCNLVSRRAPHGNELAWALRRYELGCERAGAWEALSDHVLALRALLEPEGPASGLLAGRLAALCAPPEGRLALSERVLAALALEREVIAGSAVPGAAEQTLADDMADHLRALLRDVICGHLDADLVALADELLLDPAPAGEDEVAAPEGAPAKLWPFEHAPRLSPEGAPATGSSPEQMPGDASEALEVVDVFI